MTWNRGQILRCFKRYDIKNDELKYEVNDLILMLGYCADSSGQVMIRYLSHGSIFKGYGSWAHRHFRVIR